MADLASRAAETQALALSHAETFFYKSPGPVLKAVVGLCGPAGACALMTCSRVLLARVAVVMSTLRREGAAGFAGGIAGPSLTTSSMSGLSQLSDLSPIAGDSQNALNSASAANSFGTSTHQVAQVARDGILRAVQVMSSWSPHIGPAPAPPAATTAGNAASAGAAFTGSATSTGPDDGMMLNGGDDPTVVGASAAQQPGAGAGGGSNRARSTSIGSPGGLFGFSLGKHKQQQLQGQKADFSVVATAGGNGGADASKPPVTPAKPPHPRAGHSLAGNASTAAPAAATTPGNANVNGMNSAAFGSPIPLPWTPGGLAAAGGGGDGPGGGGTPTSTSTTSTTVSTSIVASGLSSLAGSFLSPSKPASGDDSGRQAPGTDGKGANNKGASSAAAGGGDDKVDFKKVGELMNKLKTANASLVNAKRVIDDLKMKLVTADNVKKYLASTVKETEEKLEKAVTEKDAALFEKNQNIEVLMYLDDRVADLETQLKLDAERMRGLEEDAGKANVAAMEAQNLLSRSQAELVQSQARVAELSAKLLSADARLADSESRIQALEAVSIAPERSLESMLSAGEGSSVGSGSVGGNGSGGIHPSPLSSPALRNGASNGVPSFSASERATFEATISQLKAELARLRAPASASSSLLPAAGAAAALPPPSSSTASSNRDPHDAIGQPVSGATGIDTTQEKVIAPPAWSEASGEIASLKLELVRARKERDDAKKEVWAARDEVDKAKAAAARAQRMADEGRGGGVGSGASSKLGASAAAAAAGDASAAAELASCKAELSNLRSQLAAAQADRDAAVSASAAAAAIAASQSSSTGAGDGDSVAVMAVLRSDLEKCQKELKEGQDTWKFQRTTLAKEIKKLRAEKDELLAQLNGTAASK